MCKVNATLQVALFGQGKSGKITKLQASLLSVWALKPGPETETSSRCIVKTDLL